MPRTMVIFLHASAAVEMASGRVAGIQIHHAGDGLRTIEKLQAGRRVCKRLATPGSMATQPTTKMVGLLVDLGTGIVTAALMVRLGLGIIMMAPTTVARHGRIITESTACKVLPSTLHEILYSIRSTYV